MAEHYPCPRPSSGAFEKTPPRSIPSFTVAQGSHPKAGSLEPPVPAKGSDSSPNAYRKTSIGRGSTRSYPSLHRKWLHNIPVLVPCKNNFASSGPFEKTSPRSIPNFTVAQPLWAMDAVGIFWKPTFYPNHRARNPHPGDGLDPLLGPRIFRALRLGPFEGFPASM